MGNEPRLVVSYRNSTSNHNSVLHSFSNLSLYLIEILHQTTTQTAARSGHRRCILSKFYIKPQLRLERELTRCVVSYRNSTSNHNLHLDFGNDVVVVSYRNSTSNHNSCNAGSAAIGVVSYRNSTSNHNLSETIIATRRLYLIEILHQTTTAAFPWLLVCRLYLIEILHQTTTSRSRDQRRAPLYLIEILHQTTTSCCSIEHPPRCILSKFYIKPQLRLERELTRCSCILSKFYIKPQRLAGYASLK